MPFNSESEMEIQKARSLDKELPDISSNISQKECV